MVCTANGSLARPLRRSVGEFDEASRPRSLSAPGSRSDSAGLRWDQASTLVAKGLGPQSFGTNSGTSSRRCIQPGEKGVAVRLGEIVNHHLVRQWTRAAQQLLYGELKAVLVVRLQRLVRHLVDDCTNEVSGRHGSGRRLAQRGAHNVFESRVPEAQGVEAVYWSHGLS